jgi:hypothetical protein
LAASLLLQADLEQCVALVRSKSPSTIVVTAALACAKLFALTLRVNNNAQKIKIGETPNHTMLKSMVASGI